MPRSSAREVTCPARRANGCETSALRAFRLLPQFTVNSGRSASSCSRAVSRVRWSRDKTRGRSGQRPRHVAMAKRYRGMRRQIDSANGSRKSRFQSQRRSSARAVTSVLGTRTRSRSSMRLAGGRHRHSWKQSSGRRRDRRPMNALGVLTSRTISIGPDGSGQFSATGGIHPDWTTARGPRIHRMIDQGQWIKGWGSSERTARCSTVAHLRSPRAGLWRAAGCRRIWRRIPISALHRHDDRGPCTNATTPRTR